MSFKKKGPSFKSLVEEITARLQDGTLSVKAVDEKWGGDGVRRLTIEAVDLKEAIQGGVQGATGAQQLTGYSALEAAKAAQQLAAASAISIKQMRKLMGVPEQVLGEGGVVDLGEGVEPIIGFRDFLVNDSVLGQHLISRNYAVWRHREKHTAVCIRSGKTDLSHDAPKIGCDCGIYAYDLPDHPNLKQNDIVWAELALWGDVLICESGYRAEFAYPLSLFMKDNGTKVVKRVAAELEANYGVPVFLVKEREGKLASEIMGEIVADMLMGENDH